ncbi:MAG: DNA alkylation repair protein, partial [Candidatus Nealsonbacteria bacterium]|nr:DNA alkylation repair protein [Candidatus Nealsonbacteria bacterium]
KNLEGMARFGIRPKTKVLCISMPNLRKLAKKIGKDHNLAIKLWDLKIHDARILAGLIDEPDKVTEAQMDKWVNDFDSWDICDSVCGNLFDKTKFAYKKIGQWAKREEEYVKRTPFTLLAWLSVHDKDAKDEKFIKYFPIIKKAATDDRNFVKKAVNWAIRQIGK